MDNLTFGDFKGGVVAKVISKSYFNLLSVVTLLVMFMLASNSFALQVGIGYNNQAPTARIIWNDYFASEISILLVSKSTPNSKATDVTYSINPLIYSIYKNEHGKINIGIKFSQIINSGEYIWLATYPPLVTHWKKYFYGRNYGLDFILPEIEYNLPFVKDLTLISKLGFVLTWYCNESNQITYATNFYGISFLNVGLIYYFN